MPQVLDQVGDETAEIVPLLRQLFDERERARGVAIDDEIAEAEERLLLDRAEQLQDVLDGDRPAGRGRELVEGRQRVAMRTARAARDEGERGIGDIEALRVGDGA